MDQELQELAQIKDNESFIQELDNSDESDAACNLQIVNSHILNKF